MFFSSIIVYPVFLNKQVINIVFIKYGTDCLIIRHPEKIRHLFHAQVIIPYGSSVSVKLRIRPGTHDARALRSNPPDRLIKPFCVFRHYALTGGKYSGTEKLAGTCDNQETLESG
jgi:hypothetical protein